MAAAIEDLGEGTTPIPSDVTFNEGDIVLAFHGSLLYEARVLEVKGEDPDKDIEETNVKEYVVHYQGWKKSWQDTVPRDMVYEHNDDNLRVAHRLLQGATMRQQALNPVEDLDEKDKEVGSPMSAISTSGLFQLPPQLQRQMVDDWEFISKFHRLVTLPREPTVQVVLEKWVSVKRQNSDKVTREVAEGLQAYFDASLSRLLLYRFEREQYVTLFEKRGEPRLPSAVYGAEHLLRLMHKLPFMLENAAVGREQVTKIADKVNELAKYMAKNGRTFFMAEYKPAPKSYRGNVSSEEDEEEEDDEEDEDEEMNDENEENDDNDENDENEENEENEENDEHELDDEKEDD